VPWCVAKTEMQVVEVLNPLAREFKSIGTLRKELDELQEELEKAHNQVCYWKKSYGNIQCHQLVPDVLRI
jgi:hypothetical protein